MVIATLVKRRFFAFSIISLFWLVIGIANGVILTQRMTPFTVKDLSNLEDGLTIATNYLSKGEIVLAGIAIVVLIGLVVLLFIKGPQKKNGVKRKRNLAAVIMVAVFSMISTTVAVNTGIVETFFGNLAYAYRDYGVVYCFTNTWLNTGISKPDGYSEDSILNIFDKKELGDDNAMLLEKKDVDENYPNILVPSAGIFHRSDNRKKHRAFQRSLSELPETLQSVFFWRTDCTGLWCRHCKR